MAGLCSRGTRKGVGVLAGLGKGSRDSWAEMGDARWWLFLLIRARWISDS